MASSGGPLLTVDDLLHDLSKEPSPPNFPWLIRPAAAEGGDGQEDRSDDLVKEFEKTCRDLTAALERPGYEWIALSRELCGALAAADKIERSRGDGFADLRRNLGALLAIVNRGSQALEKIV